MKVNVDYFYKESYLPTKRHRNLRARYVKDSLTVDVRELSKEMFPVALIVHDFKSVKENAKSYFDFDNTDFRMFDEEIRTFEGNLYKPVRITHGVAISTLFENPEKYIKDMISRDYYRYESEIGGQDFTDASIVKSSDKEDCQSNIKRQLEYYVLCDGILYEICGEPMYVINTFGLGHNHGGTGFFIEYFYNENICRDNYFNALQREQAITYGKQTAINRGDTLSVDGMGEHDIIEVLMPELIKRNPQKEHGEGCAFRNQIEKVVQSSNSVFEAGLLACCMALE